MAGPVGFSSGRRPGLATALLVPWERYRRDSKGDLKPTLPAVVRRRVLELPAGGIAVLRVAGEIDMRTYTILRAAPDAARDSAGSRPANRCAGVVVDLAGVTFCGVGGFALPADAAVAVTAQGAGYAVSALPAHLNRYATLLWAERRPVRCCTGVVAAVPLFAPPRQPVPHPGVPTSPDSPQVWPGGRRPGECPAVVEAAIRGALPRSRPTGRSGKRIEF